MSHALDAGEPHAGHPFLAHAWYGLDSLDYARQPTVRESADGAVLAAAYFLAGEPDAGPLRFRTAWPYGCCLAAWCVWEACSPGRLVVLMSGRVAAANRLAVASHARLTHRNWFQRGDVLLIAANFPFIAAPSGPHDSHWKWCQGLLPRRRDSAV